MKIINTTPHPVTFQSRRDGKVYTIEPSGVTISAKPVEEYAGLKLMCGVYSPDDCPDAWAGGYCDYCPRAVKLVTTRFEVTDEMNDALRRLEEENPGAIIVGSIIAAQAFPGRIYGLVPVEGYERVPPAEKRMRDDKFNIVK